MDRDTKKSIQKIKSLFVHVQAQFCHPSLGTKYHINIQNINEPIFLEHLEFPYDGNTNDPIIKDILKPRTKAELEAEPSTHMIAYLLAGPHDYGVSNTQNPCDTQLGERQTISNVGESDTNFATIIRSSGVSIASTK
jgi:hypothetical protein